MSTKIRLSRHGHKDYAYYHIVVADSRAPRDGKYIERLGSYNPNTNPATVDVNFERALYWVQTGAQPTPTVHNLLSDEGVFLMKHLLGGVKKGVFDEQEAQRRFQAWKDEKTAKLKKVADNESIKKSEAAKKALAHEVEVNTKLSEALREKRATASKALEDKAKAVAKEAAPDVAPAEPEAPAQEA